MNFLRKVKLLSILPKDVGDLIRENPKWVYLIFGIAALGAFLEAVTLANLLFLGFAVLGQEPSGLLGSLIGEQVQGGYSQRTWLIGLGSSFIVLVIMRLTLLMWFRFLSYQWSNKVGRCDA